VETKTINVEGQRVEARVISFEEHRNRIMARKAHMDAAERDDEERQRMRCLAGAFRS